MVEIPNALDLGTILNTGYVSEKPARTKWTWQGNKVKEITWKGGNKGNYIPMSSIGNKCYRAVQYGWHHVSTKHPNQKKMQRIFDLGHYLEREIIEELREHGMTITRQQENCFGFAGVWKGKIDGVVTGVPAAPVVKHLLEIKSMNRKNFVPLTKNGLRKAHFGYYKVAQNYMRLMGLDRCLYVVYCKNDSIYHVERLKADHDLWRDMAKMEADICMADALYPRIGNNTPEWHECLFCNHKPVCFQHVPMDKTCRTCEHSDIENHNKWICTYFPTDHQLTLQEQNNACGNYKKSEMFITIKDITHGEI